MLAGSMVFGFAAAALAPAPSRPVAGWVQAAVGLIAPTSFCTVMALTGAGQRDAGAIAMCVLIASLAALLWLLRAPSGEDGIDEDGGDDDDGGTGRRGPSGGPGTPQDGLAWDWGRFEADFAAYCARSSDRDLELV
jgi:hypothetical protein